MRNSLLSILSSLSQIYIWENEQKNNEIFLGGSFHLALEVGGEDVFVGGLTKLSHIW